MENRPICAKCQYYKVDKYELCTYPKIDLVTGEHIPYNMCSQERYAISRGMKLDDDCGLDGRHYKEKGDK